MIVQLKVELGRAVVGSGDGRFDNLRGGHQQS